MSKLSSFLRKHSDELSLTASLFSTLFRALPIDPQEKRQIAKAVDSLQASAVSISKSIKDVEKATDLKVSKADIKAAIAELAPDLLGGLIEAGVRKALADQAKEAKAAAKATKSAK